MSNKLLKELENGLSEPMLEIINTSMKTNVIPDKWKTVKIIPIHKAGNRQECNNYRPVSLLPAGSKTLEKVVEAQLRKFLECNNILYKNQFGFRPKHETQHVLLKFIQKLFEDRDSGLHTVTIFADLKKAFDTVDHKILCKKLEYYNIESDWFKEYLTDRRQFTSVRNV